MLALEEHDDDAPHEALLLWKNNNNNNTATVTRDLATVQRRTVLIVRVNDPPGVSEAQMKQSVFGHAAQQMARCSQGT